MTMIPVDVGVVLFSAVDKHFFMPCPSYDDTSSNL